MVVGQGVVLQVAARQCDFTVYAGQVTAGRPQGIVGFVAAPADGAFVQPAFEVTHAVAVAFAVLVDKVGIAFRRAFVGVHGQTFRGQAEVHTVIFGNRNTDTQTAAESRGFILFRAGRSFTRVISLAVNVVTQAYAVRCEVWVGKRQRAVYCGFTAGRAQGNGFTRTEQVVLSYAGRHYQTGILNPTCAQVERAGRTFGQAHVQVNLVRGICHRNRIKLNVVEVAQQLNALFGTLQFGGVVRRRFHLAQLAADDFVAGFVVAGNVDFVYIDFAARLDGQHKINGMRFGIGNRLDIDFAECVTRLTHAVLDGFERIGHLRALVPFARLHGQQFFQIFFRHFQCIAFDAYIAPAEAVAFADGYFNGLLGFVFVGLDVGIQNAEVEVAVVLIEIGDFFHVLSKFLLIELVALSDPSPHTAFAQGHLFHQTAVGVNFVAFK